MEWEGEDFTDLGTEAETFAHFYAIYGDPIPAMRRVDPDLSWPKAMERAQALLSDKGVIGRIKQIQTARDKRLSINGDRVLYELSRLATHDPHDLIDIRTGDLLPSKDVHPDALVGAGIRPGERIKALELLGKYHKLFVDRHEHSGAVRLITNVEDEDGEEC